MTPEIEKSSLCSNCGAPLDATVQSCEYCQSSNPAYDRQASLAHEESRNPALRVERMLRELLLSYSRDHDKLHVNPNIPDKVAKGALSYVRTSYKERALTADDLLAVVDLTAFGSGKKGIAFTVHGLHSKSGIGSNDTRAWKATFMSCQDLAKMDDLKMTGLVNKLASNKDKTLVIDLGGPNTWLYQLLCKYQHLCRECYLQ